ncbi:globin domain-containing protein [Streptomyces longispororuber]|uniref:globin domain-containing protein n=1 Tax=Streptomyces longispororuber TaxID=68230 RepID=UPI0036FA309B
MFEARHRMDAPTTTSADNGTSGDSGSGWFTPRKPQDQPEEAQSASGSSGDGAEPAAPGPAGPTSRPSQEPPGRAAATAPPGGRTAGATDDVPGRIAPPSSSGPTTAPDAPVTAPGTPVRAPEAPVTAPEAPIKAAEAPVTAPEARQEPAAGSPTPTAAAPPGSPAPPGATPSEPLSSPAAPSDAALPKAASTGTASPDAVLVQRTMAEIAPIADKVTSYFYALLFTRHPDLRGLFPAAMDTQRDRLLAALLTAAEHIDDGDALAEHLGHLGRGHRKYGTRSVHYPAVGECLIGALSRYASASWDDETEAAWVRTYTTISQIMIDAAAEDELRAPAWWYAEIVSHDARTSDIAVITVRPDQPYPFLAGQYTSLETPWWPRIWRHYSFASAPRSDGLLSFHVKAVPAGWVSNALVHRARPGDVLRLGPPTGSMTVDHSTDSGLLCVGGGTGIAPIKALVEDVAEHGRRRPVEVFYGARTDHDLYDIDTMLRLQRSHPWLAVRPVVDNRAQLPDAVRAYGPWNEYDAYLSGPPGMIRSGVDTLRRAGIPAGRIRHDAVEELVVAGS